MQVFNIEYYNFNFSFFDLFIYLQLENKMKYYIDIVFKYFIKKSRLEYEKQRKW